MENILNISLSNPDDIFYAVALKTILESIEYEYEYATLEYADEEIMQVELDGEEFVLRYDFDPASSNVEFELMDLDEYEEEYGSLDDYFFDDDDFDDEDDFEEFDDENLLYGVEIREDGSMIMAGEYDAEDISAFWDPEDDSITVLDENDEEITDDIDEEFMEEIRNYFHGFEVYAYYEEENSLVIDVRDGNRLLTARYEPDTDRITVFKEGSNEEITSAISEDTMDAIRDEFENWDENTEEIPF